MDITVLNSLFLQLEKRAETSAKAKLIDTFVDVGPLFTLLSTKDHQVLFGRRGTGKTHVLRYLQSTREEKGDAVAFVDMRHLGSSGGLYSDIRRPIAERATGLLVDTLSAIHGSLLEYFVDQAETLNLAETGPALDTLAEAITEVEVVGTTEKSTQGSVSEAVRGQQGVRVELSPTGPALDVGSSESKTETVERTSATIHRGTERLHVNFGSTGTALRRIAELLAGHDLWILLDEWSSVPLELQPYLADLLRRSAMPVTGIVIKIAAIDHRSEFMLPRQTGDYVGIEVGADISAGTNLDDFMVFDNDEDRATEFFQGLVFAHATSLADSQELDVVVPSSKEELFRQAFTERRAVQEFVRASEGVPRDAINILVLAAQYALSEPMSVKHVRTAALNWYQRDKAKAAAGNQRANELLHWIIAEVIGSRRARAFLLKAGEEDELITSLHDARVLHILKRSISSPTNPGERYTVYKLDYGCYVDLISTNKATAGLLPFDEDTGDTGSYIDVPPDDYRSIRRAILSLGNFYSGERVAAQQDDASHRR